MASLFQRLVKLVKSEVGLLLVLAVYTFAGATAFYYTEHENDERLKVVMKDERRRFAERILNVTSANFAADAVEPLRPIEYGIACVKLKCPLRDSNPEPSGHESSTLPLGHHSTPDTCITV